jgi:serine protease AprX
VRGTAAAVMTGDFAADAPVARQHLARALVQSLGLQAEANAFAGNVSATYNGQRIAIMDEADIEPGLNGYVQLALDLNLLQAMFALQPGAFGQPPTLVAYFQPQQVATRADYAAAAVRRLAAAEAGNE